MIFLSHSSKFKKQFTLLPEKIKRKTIDRLALLSHNEFDDSLNNHPLHGEYAGCRSINITGNMRVVYEKAGKDRIHLLAIGTHSQLYE